MVRRKDERGRGGWSKRQKVDGYLCQNGRDGMVVHWIGVSMSLATHCESFEL